MSRRLGDPSQYRPYRPSRAMSFLSGRAFWVVAVAVVVIGVGLAAIVRTSGYQCDRQGRLMNMETRWDVWSSTCYVALPDGTWIDVQRYRGVNAE